MGLQTRTAPDGIELEVNLSLVESVLTKWAILLDFSELPDGASVWRPLVAVVAPPCGTVRAIRSRSMCTRGSSGPHALHVPRQLRVCKLLYQYLQFISKWQCIYLNFQHKTVVASVTICQQISPSGLALACMSCKKSIRSAT